MAEGGEASTPKEQSLEEPLGMRAVLIGATGAIGECLLGELLLSKVCCGGVQYLLWVSTSKLIIIRDCKLLKAMARLKQLEALSSSNVHGKSISCFRN